MQVYEYGGYVKSSASESILNGFSSVISAFSKFTYKKMTYDIFASARNKDYRHVGADIDEVYTLQNEGRQYEVNRNEQLLKSHERSDDYPLTFRISYNSKNFSAKNTIAFTHSSIPVSSNDGELTLGLSETDYTRNIANRSNTVSYKGSVFGIPAKSLSFEVLPEFTYTHRDNKSYYASCLEQPISYEIEEDAYLMKFDAYLRRKIGLKHNLMLGFTSILMSNHVKYRGSAFYDDDYSNSVVCGSVGYKYRTNTFGFGLTAKLGYERTEANGLRNNDLYPVTYFDVYYNLNKNNRLSAYFNCTRWSMGIDMISDDVIKDNELLYLTANPNLENISSIESNMVYNWFHSNRFSITAFSGYDKAFNRIATIYTHYDNGKSIIRDFVNNGNHSRFYFGIAGNYKLFDNNLQLYANVCQNYYHTSGIYTESIYPIRLQLQTSYYWKLFNFTVWWANGQRTLTDNSNIIIKNKNNYGVSAGWGNGKWNVELYAINFLSTDWEGQVWHQETPLYKRHSVYYSPSSHARLNFSITYTVGYGKKIQRKNEIGEQGGAASAILKRD